MNLIVLSINIKNVMGIWIGIILNLHIDLGRMVIFTVLILPGFEHGKSCHFLISFSISFFRNLKFSLQRYFTFLLRFILMCF